MALYGYPMGNQYYPQVQQPMQSGGFIPVPNIDYAKNYVVMPNTTVTFIDENAPYVYTKTRKSQFDPPVFEKLRLVREQEAQEADLSQKGINTIGDGLKAEYEALRALYEGIRKDVDTLMAERKVSDE